MTTGWLRTKIVTGNGRSILSNSGWPINSSDRTGAANMERHMISVRTEGPRYLIECEAPY